MKTQQTEIKSAISQFIAFIKLGWATEIAFECAYDQVYDIIGKEKFLDLCQSACNNQK